jgi:ABC-type branched-subunit amino acid transport system substrate-binding protein
LAGGGTIVLDEEFLPDTTDFRSLIFKIKAKEPQALFMSIQSGLAFGLFIKQFRQLRADQSVEIYTNFLSADNPEARSVAGDSMYGVHYMAPAYDRRNERLQKFLVEIQRDHGTLPVITFHTAGTVDALNILQDYIDEAKVFSGDGVRKYLLTRVRGYRGAMGVYSLDEQGNSDLGFEPAQITRDVVK